MTLCPKLFQPRWRTMYKGPARNGRTGGVGYDVKYRAVAPGPFPQVIGLR